MITARTKAQLLVFAIITLLGVTFAGAKYAQLDNLVRDPGYEVVAHFASSGGIYTGAEVDVRGVKIGNVKDMVLTSDGVDVVLDIDKSFTKISTESLAVVANRSAVGEQYVDLQPPTDRGPFLREGSTIPQVNTRVPLPTETFLTDITETVSSINRGSLGTAITELGAAFGGTAAQLETILDSSSSFIKTANENFDLTTSLLRDSSTVLDGQIATSSAIGSFSKNLALFSNVLAGSDPDLRKLIANGAAGAAQLKQFLDENNVDLSELLRESAQIGDIVVAKLPELRQVLVLYPYVVDGGFGVVDKDAATGEWRAHFGLILTSDPGCTNGYETTDKRAPQDGSTRPMNTKAHCADSPSQSNPRGVQNLKRAAPMTRPMDRSQVMGSFDAKSGQFTWGAPE